MRIALVADTFSVEKGTGIARYSEEMLKGLRSKGLYVEPIAPEAPTMPLGLAINHALRMPYFVSRKASHFDLIHATSPVTALCFPAIQQPTVVTYWDLVSLLCQNTSSAFHTRLLAPLFLRVGRFANAIIASSSQTREEMIAHLGIPSHRIYVVNPGIAEVFRPTNRPARSHSVIGCVGAFNRRKGIDYLFRSFSVLRAEGLERGTKLVLCGRRTLEYSALVQLAKDLDIDGDVEFRGFVGGESLRTAYNSFDVFVLPSEWEGFGFPILEAQRCGVPVIIREHAHIPQEVSK
jgi:glycosyltransferase involved in cell wall biosynthesis